MTDMYDEKVKVFQGGSMKPYPAEAFGVEQGRARDPVGYLRDVEQRGRERQVAYETVKLLRQKVIECYRQHGVNHYEDCRDVGQQYYDVVIKKDLGQLQPEWITK